MTTGKNHSFDYMDFIGKVMSLLFNTLSRFVIAFFPRSKCIPISWLQSPSAVIFEDQEEQSATASTSPIPSFPFLLPPIGTNNQYLLSTYEVTVTGVVTWMDECISPLRNL